MNLVPVRAGGFSTMIGAMRTPAQQLVTVFGGSGFLGRFVVRALVKRGYRVLVAVRRPELAGRLQPLGVVGQVHVVQANLRYPDSIRNAVSKADHVINLVGILQESGRQGFGAVHAEGAAAIAEAAAPDATLVHVSALGADSNSESLYARSKAQGEAALFAARPDAIVFRPSVLFGPGDGLFNRFGSLARALPVLPLAGRIPASSRLCGGRGGGDRAGRRRLGSAWPGLRARRAEIRTLRELVQYVLEATDRRRLILPLPWPVARAQGSLMGLLDKLTFGLIPDELVITRDQVSLLERDNVVSEEAIRDGRTFAGLGIVPTAPEAIVPAYLVHYRKDGQFNLARSARPSATPDLLTHGSDREAGSASGPAAGQGAARH
jgi:NADH dehydrogenase